MLDGTTHNQIWKAEEYLSALFDKATGLNIITSVVSLASSWILEQTSTRLTSLVYLSTNGSDLISHVVRTSAHTLVSLDISVERLRYVRPIIFTDDGKPVVYPRLKTLKFISRFDPESDERFQINESIAPFPALRYLKWPLKYGYVDDALFRGNNDTLEYVDIKVDIYFANIVQKFNVFSGSKHSLLSHVTFFNYADYESPALSSKMLMQYVVRLITPETRYLALYHENLSDIANADITWLHLRDIQALHLSSFRGTLQTLVRLVWLLPGLRRISCGPGKVDAKASSLEFKALVDDLGTRYGPLSRSLRLWNVFPQVYGDIASIANTSLALAITCTDFGVVLLDAQRKLMFDKAIKYAIESGLFNENVFKIGRLICKA